MSKTLTNMLETVSDASKNGRIQIGDLMHSLNSRGFGPLLLVPALFVISPVGALPGACAVFGGIILLISAQILFGRERPWIPQWLKQKSFHSKNLKSAIRKAKPFAGKLDHYLQRRIPMIARNPVVLRLTAFISLLLSIGIMSFSLIPFAPAAFALPIIFFALGFSVRDGVLIGIGYGALIITGAVVISACKDAF